MAHSTKRPFRPLSPFLAWPSFFATPPLVLSSVVHGLELSQTEQPEALELGRQTQLRLLLEWAVNNVPYYRKATGYADMLASIRRRPDELDAVWARLPILTKAQLRSHGPRLHAPSLPAGHGKVLPVRTSGSTGTRADPLMVGLSGIVRAAAIDVPFMCCWRRAVEITDDDPYGELRRYLSIHRELEAAVFRTVSYVDGPNFAARATAPALFSVGLMDVICPPSTVFAAYNDYAGPKDISVWPFNGHEAGQQIQQSERYAFFARSGLAP